jgi:endonuclease/exonuclease/phosphatase (EEP) superfamily protein YafD
MTNQFAGKNAFANWTSIGLIAGIALTIVPFDNNFSRATLMYAVQIMFGYFLFGSLMMALKQPRLMMLSYGCCAALCLFLKTHSNEAIMFPKRNADPALKVAYLNTSNAIEGYQGFVDDILDTEADLVAIEEVTPDWDMVFKQSLAAKYPYSRSIVRADFFGQAVYSKYPLPVIDTFYYKDIPNIVGTVKLDNYGSEISFVSTHTEPSFMTKNFYQELRSHLNKVVEKFKDFRNPKIALGTFNTVEWATEIQDFRLLLRLQSSRRDNNPFSRIPFDHIFYSNDLECIYFSPLFNKAGEELGIQGIYQFSTGHAAGTYQ